MKIISRIVAATLAVLPCSITLAAEDRWSVIEEIVVTAQRKEENSQDVSISITAIGGDQLREMNMQDAQRITDQVPNFYAGGLGGPGGPPFLVMRGISFIDFSNVNEASVGVYLDEVYMASQGSGTMQLFDMERVEVLRGPQGTLFGRNTTAGVAHFISRKPTEAFEGYASLQYGSYDQVIGEFALSGALGERARGRIAGKYNNDDGWQENKITGDDEAATDAQALRAILEFDLSETWVLEANIHWAENDGTSPVPLSLFGLDPTDLTQYCGGNPVVGTATDQSHADQVLSGGCANDLGVVLDGQDADEGYSERSHPMEYESTGGYLKLVGELEWATLTSITGYEEYEQHFGYDIDAYDYTASPLLSDLSTNWQSDAEQLSQEFRLNGTYNDTDWTIGTYYYTAEQASGSCVDVIVTGLGHICSFTDGETETDSWALFGQLQTPITETVSIIAGLRYTDETRELTKLDCFPAGAIPVPNSCVPPGAGIDEIETSATTGKFAVEWRPQDGQLYYAQFSHGFKSGGFNPNSNLANRGPVDEETVDSFELGMKSYFADGKVRINTAVFYNEFKGLQALVGSVDEDSNPIVFYINAGDPDIVGAEVEVAWAPTENLELLLGVAILDTEINADPSITADGVPADAGGRQLNGKELAQAPDLAFNAVIRYYIPLADNGTITLQADGRWQDDIYTGIDNDPVEFVESYGVYNIRARWSSDDYSYTAEAFVDNVSDETVIQHIFHNTGGGHASPANSAGVQDGFRTPGRPRTWGVKFGMNF